MGRYRWTVVIVGVAVVSAAVILFFVAAPVTGKRPSVRISTPEPSVVATSTVAAGYVDVPILVYHNVRPHEAGETRDQRTYGVVSEDLEKQLAFLDEHGYNYVTMGAVTDWILGKGSLPEKPIALTFDDGRDTQYSAAWPILKRHYAVATFYVLTNAIGRDGYLTWDQLKEMKDAGSEVGSHSVYHPYLWKVTDPKELESEIGGSKAAIDDRLDVSTTAFAYPFGPSSPQVVDRLKLDGYSSGRILSRRHATATTSPFELPGAIATDDLRLLESFLRE
jgi:peptidoglycan/xylan/chitin deacetylase (PgdA/CDA1 family)